MLPKIFGWFVILHGSICVVIAAITMFHGVGKGATRVSIDSDLFGSLLLFGGGKLDQFVTWLQDVHHSAEICNSAVDCVGRLFDHAFELFFMYVYLPLTAMFATFVIDQTMTNKRILGILFDRSRPRTASMPALENSENNARTSNSNKASKSPASSARSLIRPPKKLESYGSSLVYDDIFGLIPKDIIDSWSQNQRIGAGARIISGPDTTQLPQSAMSPAYGIEKLRSIPPVRNRAQSNEAIS
jgi:hypothetical protein